VLLDLAPVAERPPAEQLQVLLDELGAYQPDLLVRERVVVGSRADLALDAARADDGDGHDAGDETAGEGDHAHLPVDMRISSVTGAGIPQLRGRLAEVVRAARSAEAEPTQFVVHRPVREGYKVVREGGGWVVEGREATRAVALSDLTRADALDEAHRRLKSLGVDRALARAGAKGGDNVRIGGLVFSYEEDEGVRR
jgi:GTP-binding protein